jgi:prepilin-type N-terminal cleavage/methylation domain-containing protein
MLHGNHLPLEPAALRAASPRRPRRGFTLIELILVLSVGSMIMMLSFQGMKRGTENDQARIVGQQMQEVGRAVDTYIASRYTPISQLQSAAGGAADPGPRTCSGTTCTITVQTLVNEGLLPATYKNLNSFGAGYTITLNVTGTSPNWNVVGVVTTDKPWTVGGVVRYDLLGQAMATAGADSGMSRSSAARIDGYGGVWTAPITTGQALGLLGFQVGTGTGLYSVYLRRDGTLPMTGDLNLSDGTNHNIINANNVTGTGRFTSAQTYTNYVNLAGNLDMTGTATVGGSLGVTGATTVGQNLTVNGSSHIAGGESVGGTITAGGNLATNGLSPSDFPSGSGGGLRTWDVDAGGTVGVGVGTAGLPFGNTANAAYAAGMTRNGDMWANGSLAVQGSGRVGGLLATNGFDPHDVPSTWAGGIRTWDIAAGGTVMAGYKSGNASGNDWQKMGAAGITQNFGPYSGTRGYLWANSDADIGGTLTANYLVPKGTATVGGSCSPNGVIGTDGNQTLFCANGTWTASGTITSIAVFSGWNASATASCPAGYQVTGGSCDMNRGSDGREVAARYCEPSGNGYSCNENNGGTCQAIAVCSKG